jgi:uncharacterized DUF497 family protein
VSFLSSERAQLRKGCHLHGSPRIPRGWRSHASVLHLLCVRYVWDPKKERSNRQKHGVAFEEAVTSFADPLAIIADDLVHPERAILIGMSRDARMLVTVFIDRTEDQIRLISARLATRPERRRYEEDD